MKFNHWLPKLLTFIQPGITTNAIVLFGRIYFKDNKEHVDKELFRHELKHVEQQKEDGIKFYFKYISYYLIGLIKYFSHFKAYKNIPYEVEARKAEKQ